MKVLITNSVVLNGGEAATVTAIVALLRRAFGHNTQCIIYEHTPKIAAKYYPDLAFRRLLYYRLSRWSRIWIVGGLIARANRARFNLAAKLWARGSRRLARLVTFRQDRIDLDHYASADMVVATGGTYLVDNYDLNPRIFDFELTLAMGRPLVLFTQSIGPLERPGNRARLRPLMERANLILLRDEQSLRHVRSLPVRNANVHLSADAVFALRNGHASRRRNLEATRQERPLRVAISVRYWPYFKSRPVAEGMAAYRRAIAGAVADLVRRHHAHVTFLSSCQGIREYWFDDSQIAMKIFRELDPAIRGRVEVDRRFRDPAAMIDELAGYDLVIATRFHMAVFALLAGTPAVAIGYEFKTNELFSKLGAAQLVHDIERVTAASLGAAVDQILVTYEQLRGQLDRAVSIEHESALEAGERLRHVCAQSA